MVSKLTKAQLKRVMAAGYAARNELQEREDAALTKKHAALIGQCQKYLNSYGSGSPPWWLYRRIVSIDGRWVRSFQFQTDCHGKTEFQVERMGCVDSPSWTNITDKEFNDAFDGAMLSINVARDRAAEGKSEVQK